MPDSRHNDHDWRTTLEYTTSLDNKHWAFDLLGHSASLTACCLTHRAPIQTTDALDLGHTYLGQTTPRHPRFFDPFVA